MMAGGQGASAPRAVRPGSAVSTVAPERIDKDPTAAPGYALRVIPGLSPGVSEAFLGETRPHYCPSRSPKGLRETWRRRRQRAGGVVQLGGRDISVRPEGAERVHFARFDARLEQRVAELRAEVRAGFARAEAELDRRIGG